MNDASNRARQFRPFPFPEEENPKLEKRQPSDVPGVKARKSSRGSEDDFVKIQDKEMHRGR